MKSKLIIIMSVLIILCSSLVSAATTLNDSIAYWSFDVENTSATVANDTSGNGRHGTMNTIGNVNLSGILGTCLNSTSGVEITVNLPEGAWTNFDQPHTWSFWKWTNAYNVLDYNVWSWDQEATMCFVDNSVGRFKCRMRNGGVWEDVIDPDTTTGTWKHYMKIYDGTIVNLYVDNVAVDNVTTSVTALADTNFLRVKNGRLDEVGWWDRAITEDEQNALYNSGAGFNPFAQIIIPPASPNITVTLFSPSNNTINNSEEPTNFVYTPLWSNGNMVNCSLYTTVNNWSIANTTTSMVNNTFNNLKTNLTEGNYLWNVGCNNGSKIYFAESNFTLTVDLTNPTIISTTFLNNSVYANINLTSEFIFFDNNLIFSINITIPGTGISIYELSGINNQTVGINISQNITSLTAGDHILSVRVADGHTANKLKAPQSYKANHGIFDDYTEFEFEAPYKEGRINIKQKDGSLFDNWGHEKKEDKYKFSFQPNNKKSSYTFEVEAESYIYIMEESKGKYKQWLVYDEHWLDFMPYTNVDIVRITDNKVEVTVNDVDPTLEEIVFDSIGDLNILTINYTFKKVSVTETFTTPILQTLEEQTTLLLDINSNVNLVEPVILTWNNTNFTADLLIDNSTLKRYNVSLSDYNNQTFFWLDDTTLSINVSHRWWFNFSNSTSIEFTELQNQSIEFVGIDNCTNFGTHAINFTLKVDDNATTIVGTLDGYFETSFNGMGLKAFNISWANNSKFSLCITPANEEYDLFAQFDYQDQKNVYNEETYYLTNSTLSNRTQMIDLFLTPGASIVTFNVKDEFDNDVEDVFLHVLQYDIGTNSYVTTEILKTDTSGEAVGNVVLNTVFYRFFLFKDGILWLQTEPVKLTTTDRTFRINFQGGTSEKFETIYSTRTSLSFTNSTKNFVYTFTNPSGGSIEACLRVDEMSRSGKVLLNQTCLTSASGTILINVGNATTVIGRTFLAEGILKVNPTLGTESLTITFTDDFKKFGNQGLFAAFFLRMTVSMIGIWSPIAAIGLMLFMDILLIISGVFYMSWDVLIIYVALAVMTLWRIKR